MTTAFQANAFQANAFQIDATPTPAIQIIDTGIIIGPTFATELTAEDPDLLAVVGWRSDGMLSFSVDATEAQITAVQDVLAVHVANPTAYASDYITALGGNPATESAVAFLGAAGATQPATGSNLLSTVVSGSATLRSRLHSGAGKNFAHLIDAPTLSSYRLSRAADFWCAAKNDPVFGVAGTHALHLTADEVTAAEAAGVTLGLGALGTPSYATSTFPIPPHSIIASTLGYPGTTIPAGATRDLALYGGTGFGTSGSGPVMLTPRTLFRLRVYITDVQPASGSLVVTLFYAGAPSALVVTIPANGAYGVYPTSPAAANAPPVLVDVDFAGGTPVYVSYRNNAGAPSAPVYGHELSVIGTEFPA